MALSRFVLAFFCFSVNVRHQCKIGMETAQERHAYRLLNEYFVKLLIDQSWHGTYIWGLICRFVTAKFVRWPISPRLSATWELKDHFIEVNCQKNPDSPPALFLSQKRSCASLERTHPKNWLDTRGYTLWGRAQKLRKNACAHLERTLLETKS